MTTPAFDWSGVSAWYGGWATGHFATCLSAWTASDRPLGYAQQAVQSTSRPADLLAAVTDAGPGTAWTVKSEWRAGTDEYLLAVAGAMDSPDAVIQIYSDQGDNSLSFAALAASYADAEFVIDQFTQHVEGVDPAGDNGVAVRFWAMGVMGPISYSRRIEASDWTDVRGNYSLEVRDQLEALMGMRNGPDSGRLMLLHGPPGSGKSNLIRALGVAWADWCDVAYIVDPDEFFGTASYMIDVMLGAQDDRWRVIIVEDADELISANAKTQSGQGTSRLLNLADGLVGQGLRVLVCVTTNEPVEALHPAMIRPGRCFANLYVGTLSGAEANGWRESHGLAVGDANVDASLAELYAELRGHRDVAVIASAARREWEARGGRSVLHPGGEPVVKFEQFVTVP